MFETIVAGLVLAAVSGAAFVAYNHPKEFGRAGGWFFWIWAGLGAAYGLMITGYYFGLQDAKNLIPSDLPACKEITSRMEKIDAKNFGVKVVFWSVIIYLVILGEWVSRLKKPHSKNRDDDDPE